MRLLSAIGFTALGFALGAGALLFGARTQAQVSSTDQLNARFAIGPKEYGYLASQLSLAFRFVKDKQTGDCYLTYTSTNALDQMVKTDDNACSGF